MKPDIKDIASRFDINGDFVDAFPYGNGHINDTYLSRFKTTSGYKRYVHQRINQNVFKNPPEVMENIERVLTYIRSLIQCSGGDIERECLTIINSRDNSTFIKSDDGSYWRTYIFIEGVSTHEKAENYDQAFNAAWGFGNFQKQLNSLPGKRLYETIHNFHFTPARMASFIEAIEKDTLNRAKTVKEEIEFVLSREKDVSVVTSMLASGVIPERVTHNDTKFNNVLIDDLTGKSVCVIDLDTVMPGTSLYDFGDLVRMGAATADEDEPDFSRAGIDLEVFKALAYGFISGAGSSLNSQEIEYLAFGAKLITFEQGIRFLGDYINGDTYYKIKRPLHNLDRARTQLKMVAEIEKNFDILNKIVLAYTRSDIQ